MAHSRRHGHARSSAVCHDRYRWAAPDCLGGSLRGHRHRGHGVVGTAVAAAVAAAVGPEVVVVEGVAAEVLARAVAQLVLVE